MSGRRYRDAAWPFPTLRHARESRFAVCRVRVPAHLLAGPVQRVEPREDAAHNFTDGADRTKRAKRILNMSWEGWLWTQFGANPSLVSNSLFSGNLPGKLAGKGSLGRLHSPINALFQ